LYLAYWTLKLFFLLSDQSNSWVLDLARAHILTRSYSSYTIIITPLYQCSSLLLRTWVFFPLSTRESYIWACFWYTFSPVSKCIHMLILWSRLARRYTYRSYWVIDFWGNSKVCFLLLYRHEFSHLVLYCFDNCFSCLFTQSAGGWASDSFSNIFYVFHIA
jgi:hypothetical protein